MPRCVSMVTLKSIKLTKEKKTIAAILMQSSVHCKNNRSWLKNPLYLNRTRQHKPMKPVHRQRTQDYEVRGQPGQIQGQPELYSETLPKKSVNRLELGVAHT